jgi:hypothetical protein
MTEFSMAVFQNEFLAEGATSMDAIVTVTARGSDAGTGALAPGSAAEILIIDTSGSMTAPSSRIQSARLAAAEAIDGIRDGVQFAVVAGSDVATTVFPAWGTNLAVADHTTRSQARDAVKHLDAGGGTAMSTWLVRAHELFATTGAAMRHAILLTDGENREDPRRLDDALRLCTGVFQADCRGVGTDWIVSELRKIATALLGTVDIIPSPELMEDEFRALMEAAMGRGVSGATLRLWCPQGARINFVRQVAPAVEDMTSRAVPVNPMTNDYPLGAWGDEERDYHVSISVPANAVGVEMLAARVSLLTGAGPDTSGQALVKAIWTSDEVASARISPEVAHYTGQAELAANIQEGLEALKAGDERTATVKLGRATQLAVASGHDGTVRLLKKVVDIEDERTGTVRIRKDIDKADEMALDTRSTRTVRVGGAASSKAPS